MINNTNDYPKPGPALQPGHRSLTFGRTQSRLGKINASIFLLSLLYNLKEAESHATLSLFSSVGITALLLIKSN